MVIFKRCMCFNLSVMRFNGTLIRFANWKRQSMIWKHTWSSRYYSVESLFAFSFSYERPWSLRYFLGIVVAWSPKGLCLKKISYWNNWYIGSKPIDTPMDPNICLDQNIGEPLDDPRQYRPLIDKLIYWTVEWHDIKFVVGVLSR